MFYSIISSILFSRNFSTKWKKRTRPKIHKTGNPACVLVSSVDCHNNTVSKYVDFYLQSTVKNISSCVRVTIDFLQKLDKVKNIPNDSFLVIFDMKSICTNIPNNEVTKSVREASDNHPTKTVAAKVIITFSTNPVCF